MAVEVKAPMPGTILEILVDVGDKVSVDQELIIIEAMKMEIPVSAPSEGKVVKVKVENGDKIETDQVLLVLE